MVPLSVVLLLVRFEETVVLRIINEEVANHWGLGTHRNIGEVVVIKAGCTAVNWISGLIVPFNPNANFTNRVFAGRAGLPLCRFLAWAGVRAERPLDF